MPSSALPLNAPFGQSDDGTSLSASSVSGEEVPAQLLLRNMRLFRHNAAVDALVAPPSRISGFLNRRGVGGGVAFEPFAEDGGGAGLVGGCLGNRQMSDVG